ncbi:trypsin-like peptidase domain-containing protein [Sinorhizobium fredii]|uniref:trypsin-like peptidase domain-containing protein n=1 Tax=Rhizobium fredii TaxID=380 RepID=UPI003513A05B
MMLRFSRVLAIIATFGLATQPAGARGLETGLSAMLDRVRPAVVSIRTTTSGILTGGLLEDPNVRKVLGIPDDVLIVQSGAIATGSGVIIDGGNGYIVTSSHLIANADHVSVTIADGRVFQADIVGSDAPTDLAVVKIDASSLSALNWGRSSDLKVGDFVVAVGSPFGLTQTATFGMVSGLGRSGLGADEYEDYIQTDAPVNPGSSGGALVNYSGELVGVTRGIPPPSEGSSGIGFAIPSDIATRIVGALIADGEYKRGWLGASVAIGEADEITGEAQGLVVDELACNSAAERQGLRLGDVIIAVDGRALKTEAVFKNAMSLLPVNARIMLDIRRGDKSQRLSLTLSDRDNDVRNSAGTGLLESVAIGFPPATASQACTTNGPVLLDVPSGSLAHSLGLRTGDYVTAINGEAATSAAEIRGVLESAEGMVSVDILRTGTAYRIEID